MQTVIVKWAFPVLWTAGCGYSVLEMWIGPAASDPAQPVYMKWVAILVWIVGTGVALRLSAGLQRVQLDGGALYVSNHFREI